MKKNKNPLGRNRLLKKKSLLGFKHKKNQNSSFDKKVKIMRT